MTGDRVTFTLSPKSPYVDCSWMDGPQVGRKTIEFSAFVKAIQESAPAPTACSGLLPPGTISYCESPNHQITMTVESSDEYADITYFNTRYEHFPLPHLIFCANAGALGAAPRRRTRKAPPGVTDVLLSILKRLCYERPALRWQQHTAQGLISARSEQPAAFPSGAAKQ